METIATGHRSPGECGLPGSLSHERNGLNEPAAGWVWPSEQDFSLADPHTEQPLLRPLLSSPPWLGVGVGVGVGVTISREDRAPKANWAESTGPEV